jgi:hypothetical protein
MPKMQRQEEYYDLRTPERYIQMGEWTGMSPARMNFAMKQLFTESNLWSSALGEFMDGALTGFQGENWKNIQTRDGLENLKRTPFIRRVLKTTYPKPLKEAEEAQMEINVMQTHNDHLVNQLLAGRKVGDVPDAEINALLDDIYEGEGGQLEFERVINKLKNRLKNEGISTEIMNLKFGAVHPHARAIGFYALITKNPDKAAEYIQQADEVGIASEEFKKKLTQLVEQADTSSDADEEEKGEDKEVDKKEDKPIGPTSMSLPTIKESRGKDIYMDVEIEETGKTKKMKISALEVRKDIRRRQKALGELINTMNDEG